MESSPAIRSTVSVVVEVASVLPSPLEGRPAAVVGVLESLGHEDHRGETALGLLVELIIRLALNKFKLFV